MPSLRCSPKTGCTRLRWSRMVTGCRAAWRVVMRSGPAMSAFHRELASQGTVNAGQSRLVLHDTADADVFIAELDAVLDHPGGRRVSAVSLVQIFRIRAGRIAVLRDYFTP